MFIKFQNQGEANSRKIAQKYLKPNFGLKTYHKKIFCYKIIVKVNSTDHTLTLKVKTVYKSYIIGKSLIKGKRQTYRAVNTSLRTNEKPHSTSRDTYVWVT